MFLKYIKLKLLNFPTNLRHKIIAISIILLICAFTTTSFRLDCRYRFISFTFGDVYSCDGTPLIDDSSTTISAIDGTHLSEKSTADVRGIRLWEEKCVLNQIPSNFEEFFPNLVALWLNDCNLREISARDFENFTQLIEIDLAMNRLEFIHENLFAHLTNLSFIFLNNNRISYVGPNILQPLSQSLNYVSFLNNPCISSKYFNQASESSNNELRDFIIDLAVQCPLTIKIIENYNDEQVDENLKISSKSNWKLSQEEMKLEIYQKMIGNN